MIHCDDVFDILTRGPFPTGAVSDGAVESHLSRCAECRRLAEALRPAIALFREAVTPEESQGLPSYGGHWRADADGGPNGEFDDSAEPLPLPRHGAAPRQMRFSARLCAQAVPWAAAVLVGIALTIWLPRAGTSPDARLTEARWRLDQTPSQWLFEHNARKACYDASPPVHSIVARLNGGEPSATVRVACCKGCHADANPRGNGYVRANELLATCVACHQF
ncbi:MAG TPA: hypothetical protein VMV69_21395 [Pirellulales bacterium]|nr:hypothetical protein [Pirellulales bacterium]